MRVKGSFLQRSWAKLSRREQTIFVLTCLTAVSALLYLVPFSLQERSVQTLRTNIANVQKETITLSLQIEELKKRKNDPKQVSPGWELADQKSLILFLEDMSGAARTVGVNLVGVTPSQEVDKKTHKEVSMNLDLKGRYRELGEYFRKLESLSKLVNIRRVRLEACPDTASICAAHIEAVTYMTK